MLITGACGFVGSIFADHFKDADLIDNLSRNGTWINYEKYKNLGRNIYLENIEGFNPPRKYDVIIHCAANPSILDWEQSPQENHIKSITTTLKICRMAEKFKATVIFISSSRVYPILSKSPISENVPMIGERSHYGASKLIAETIIREYDFPSHIFRCGLLAGVGQFGEKTQGLVSFWINQWKQGEAMEIFGFGGKQERDVLHPRDMIELIEKAAKTKDKTLCNISGGHNNAFTINELSEFCEKAIGKRQIRNMPGRPKDMEKVVLDISLAKDIWGWQPKTTKREIFEEILKC